MFTYFIQKHKSLIIIIVLLLICSIAIAIGIYAQITDSKIISENPEKSVSQDDYSDLKTTFNSIFTNSVNIDNSLIAYNNITNPDEIIYHAYTVDENKTGEYLLKGEFPMFKIETENTKKMNDEIYNIFISKFLDILQNSSSYVISTIDYVGYVNNNIVSLVIRCSLKEGTSPQRVIIKTYNYDIKNDKIISLYDMLSSKNLKPEDVQDDIYEEIENQIRKNSSINTEGYNVYKRISNDDMYEIANTTTYFLGRNNNLYILYPYGNNNFTSEMDLIIY